MSAYPAPLALGQRVLVIARAQARIVPEHSAYHAASGAGRSRPAIPGHAVTAAG